MNIPLSSVLFARDASVASPTVTSAGTAISSSPLTRTIIAYKTDSDGAPTIRNADTNATIAASNRLPGAKLTIVDDVSSRKDFTIPQDTYSGTAGSSISIPYENALTGNNEYITALIKDSSDEGLYRYTLKHLSNTNDDANGTITMTLPDLADGVYTLVIMNEQCNDAYKTNYAGYDIVSLIIISDDKGPVMTDVYRNEDGTNFKFTASDKSGLYSVNSSNGDVLKYLTNSNITTNIINCGHQSSIIVQDSLGNETIIDEKNIMVDRTPPSVSILHYTDGKYILSVSDNESGIWKITNGDGTTVYKDYSIST